MKAPTALFWFACFRLGGRTIKTAHGGRYAANSHHQCEVIPFPIGGIGRLPTIADHGEAPGGGWCVDRLQRVLNTVWDYPRTHGVFVVQRLLSIVLAVLAVGLFNRFCG